ncbi:MAG: S9 family peptidase [Candidatus Delongbacteria bacterium]|nr:S9 family peptidase [Candidatus Delongbacteria bacterium]MBN2833877.1 S9 family peptidase [Candidatus Delongbacteria bacterium]
MMYKIILPFLILVLSLEAGYVLPKKEIVDIFDAKPIRYMKIIDNTTYAVEFSYLLTPPLERISREFLSLAGKKIDPVYNTEKEDYPYTEISVRNLEDNKTWNITDTEDKYIYAYKVSPEGDKLAYITEYKGGLVLKVKLVKNGNEIYKSPFFINNATDYLAFNWLDNNSLLASKIPEDRGDKPVKTIDFVSPIVKETSGKVSKVRTYQDLLENGFDVIQFDYYFTSQIVKIDLKSSKVEEIYKPGIFRDFSISPNGEYFLIKETLKPYSYSVPAYLFSYRYFIADNNGKEIKELVKKPILDQIPTWGVETGMRYPFWASNANSTLLWAEAQDGGDPQTKVDYRDFMYKMDVENMIPVKFMELKERFGGIEFFKEAGKILIEENDYEKEWIKKTIVNFNLDEKPFVLEDRSENDRYNDPGKTIKKADKNGNELIFEKDGYIYYQGSGATEKGSFPFLDRLNIAENKKERIFVSGEDEYARFVDFYNGDLSKLVIISESSTVPPNYFILDKKNESRTKISSNVDPTPLLREIKKELVKYEREDSLALSGTLYYPLGYEEGKKYPLFIWAYPREFRDASTASQVSGSENKFTRVWGDSQLYFALCGYMVLDNASMPVVGDVIKRNDTFKDQIVSSAKAAIDYLDGRGLIDREKVAVGGHSYGAFMTANLLSSCDLFKAGIAKSGAYNRTLTPFGFQSERRSYWEAKEFYNEVSPFMHADKIKTPLLLVHGQNDPNPGTFPIQSERLFDAIKGNGGTARLVLLPYEGHGYSARESSLHVLSEMINWLDKYLKDNEEK